MPEKRFYIPRGMPISETAIEPGFFRDLYIALGTPISENNWSVRIYIKPFIRWIWFGGLLMAFGAFVSAIGGFKRAKQNALNKNVVPKYILNKENI